MDEDAKKVDAGNADYDDYDVRQDKPAKRAKKQFSLRYNSRLASRFDSKNNSGKRVAYVMLAAELSVEMQREFVAKQVQDKFAKMKTEWSVSKPSLPSPTGNLSKAQLPMHYDIMLEYWGTKVGNKRESLMSTDDCIEDDNVVVLDDEEDDVEIKTEEPQKKKQKKNNVEKKPKDAAASLEAGFNSIKEGLMFLGSSMSGVQPQATPGATLYDVLTAIKAQSDTMTQLLAQKKD
ncbi:hypothetical protein H257_07585 [Aphanomyces astaci]|uniref:Uncharacterized protein n=1 Tax=Aphanomyces astaci TaxID=112090 RepID=W4GGC3_APHAT|nr:hypothetical protein H257_07585 [Aphanomyces astaci]ETV78742.1 hypothetical protein H257_07585 [Aphanomyces astaci]|eukprot:XP_009831461.1 hypothetical protein H257_07585 [Aphanomyces astaci]